MNRGYIKLHRKLLDSFFYDDPQAVFLWIHLLLTVNYVDKDFMFNQKRRTCKKGSRVTGILKLSEETGINKSKIERLLKLFESENLIERQRTNKFSIISIANWEKYQVDENQDEKRTRSEREASEKQVRTTKERKKERNINNKEKVSKDTKKKNLVSEIFISYCNGNEDLLACLYDYEISRSDKKKTKLDENKAKYILKKLDKLSGGDDFLKIDILEQSIANGYTGLFPVKQEKTNKAKNIFEQYGA